MSEQPNLAHVATTLQFCLEQLELCEAALQRSSLDNVTTAVSTARAYIHTGLRILAVHHIEPALARVASEGGLT